MIVTDVFVMTEWHSVSLLKNTTNVENLNFISVVDAYDFAHNIAVKERIVALLR